MPKVELSAAAPDAKGEPAVAEEVVDIEEEETAALVDGSKTGKTDATVGEPTKPAAGGQSALAAAAASHTSAGGAFSGPAAMAIVFWLVMSCSVILFNKYLYNGTFPYPITLTSIQ